MFAGETDSTDIRPPDQLTISISVKFFFLVWQMLSVQLYYPKSDATTRMVAWT